MVPGMEMVANAKATMIKRQKVNQEPESCGDS
jgi:hypothetical protein